MAFEGAQRVPNKKLDLFIKRNFLSPEECAEVMARIDAKRRPSDLVDHDGDPYFRTSETCDLWADDPLISQLDLRIAAYAGQTEQHGELMQGQRYAVGQEFKAHTDYFEPDGPGYQEHCARSGQRTWTVMIYLNNVDEGGATRFKHIDKIVQPEQGKLLAWNNQDAFGRPNPNTLHHGMKVRKGTKYIITKWYRERPWG
ncbi:prolyl hydroxylase family protein [Sphingoaurantiacus capsulatus]|uniref:Prolyl hydroxylase family protein n=1 Tax=Sphingoaurantiacus capsulatus TaxID=1771310 RepID=A0ABV7XCW7_9SPHN